MTEGIPLPPQRAEEWRGRSGQLPAETDLVEQSDKCVSYVLGSSGFEIQGFCGAPAFLTPLRSLTGPLGQHLWNWDLLLALSRYIGDPDVIHDHWLR
jgi:hypothetical protein